MSAATSLPALDALDVVNLSVEDACARARLVAHLRTRVRPCVAAGVRLAVAPDGRCIATGYASSGPSWAAERITAIAVRPTVGEALCAVGEQIGVSL